MAARTILEAMEQSLSRSDVDPEVANSSLDPEVPEGALEGLNDLVNGDIAMKGDIADQLDF